MAIDTICSELTPIFQDVFDEDDVVVTPALTAADVDEWDSLSHIRLVVAIEAHYGLSFTSAEMAGLRDCGELAAVIARKTGRA